MLSPDKATVGAASVAFDLAPEEMNSLIEAIGATYGKDFPIPESGQTVYSFDDAIARVHGFLDPIDFSDASVKKWNFCCQLKYPATKIDYFETLFLAYKNKSKSIITNLMLNFIRDCAIIDKKRCIAYMKKCGRKLEVETGGFTHSFFGQVSEDDINNDSPTVTADIVAKYKEMAERQKSSRKKELLAHLYMAMRVHYTEIPEMIGLSPGDSNARNVYPYAKRGQALAVELKLPPLPEYKDE